MIQASANTEAPHRATDPRLGRDTDAGSREYHITLHIPPRRIMGRLPRLPRTATGADAPPVGARSPVAGIAGKVATQPGVGLTYAPRGAHRLTCLNFPDGRKSATQRNPKQTCARSVRAEPGKRNQQRREQLQMAEHVGEPNGENHHNTHRQDLIGLQIMCLNLDSLCTHD